MSRRSTQLSAPGMSSGRSRGNSLGQGGFSYTTQTTTINTIDSSGNRTQIRDEYSHMHGGSSCAHKPLRSISEDHGYDSDSSDDTVVGSFSNMRLGGCTDSRSTIRGPRVVELSDAHVGRLTSGSSSSHHSGSHYSSCSRPSDSHHSSSRVSTRPSESHYSSSSRPTDSHHSSSRMSTRPSESHYSSSSRPADSHHPSSRISSRPSESPYSSSRPTHSHRRSTLTSSRPSESHTYGAGKEVAVYDKPSKTKSSRRDSKLTKGIKSLVRNI